MPTEVEVDPREALREGRESGAEIPQPTDIDQIDADEPQASASAPSPTEDVVNTLRPTAEQRVWEVRDIVTDDSGNTKTTAERKYVQKPLSYFAKMEFFGLVGEVIDKAVSGENGIRISSLFDVPGARGAGGLTAADFQDADTFLQAVGKLLTYAPDFLQKCYCIWWSVPEYERPWVIDVISRDPDHGGLTDDEGIEAIEVFIDQNWDALDSFFREKISSLRDRVQSHRQQGEESLPSRP